jgi:large subunit ribosomal protein L4
MNATVTSTFDLKMVTAAGKASKKTIPVSAANFERKYNETLVHQVVTAYLAGGRSGTRATKNRAAVRGGGEKPWRQKGTGRARAGTLSSPIWRSGGMTFAVQPRDYSQKINKQMYRNGLRTILSELTRQERIIVVETLKIDEPKTKQLVNMLKAMQLDSDLNKVLIVVDDLDDNLILASRNLYKVNVCTASQINPVLLVGSDKVLLTAGAVTQIEEVLK